MICFLQEILRPAFSRRISALRSPFTSQSAYQPDRRTFFSFSSTYLIKNSTTRWLKRNFSEEISNSGDQSSCSCTMVLGQKINDLIFFGDRQGLKKYLMENCLKAKSLKEQWNAYSSDRHRLTSSCNAEDMLRDVLSVVVSEELHVMGVGSVDHSTVDLSALTMEKGLVTLAGEGGAIVGKSEYWQNVFEILENNKKTPVRVISIGGGTGNDGEAIATVFKSKGLSVQCCEIVDPNLLAAWMASENKVMFYTTTAQEYFSEFFKREEEGRYVFHLGTLLNVVPEDVAINILQVLAKNMTESDILSVFMVDEKQFSIIARKDYITRADNDNQAGLAKYIYTESKHHYKTIISDRAKFLNFCENLGLKKIDFAETQENAQTVLQVTFIAFKGIKLETGNFIS